MNVKYKKFACTQQQQRTTRNNDLKAHLEIYFLHGNNKSHKLHWVTIVANKIMFSYPLLQIKIILLYLLLLLVEKTFFVKYIHFFLFFLF